VARSDSLILQWDWHRRPNLKDRIEGLEWTLSNGSTVFVASGLDAGAGSSSYIISDVSDHFADPGDYTIFLDFTPAASQVADAWMFTFSNVSDTGNMDVSTLRADNSYDWVRQRSGVPNINQGGPAESPVTNRHRVAYYVSGTNGNRMAVNGAYVAAETNQLYPLGGGAWDFHLFRQPGLPASGLFNGVMHEVRVYDGHVGDGDFGNKGEWWSSRRWWCWWLRWFRFFRSRPGYRSLAEWKG
jgi:hypothetical protein